MKATALAAMTCGSGPPSTSGQPRSTCSLNSCVAQHQPPPRPAQGLVRRGRHDMGIRDRIEFSLEHLAGHQAREVGHVDHEDRADPVGDRAHPGVVDVARIGAEAGQQNRAA